MAFQQVINICIELLTIQIVKAAWQYLDGK